MEEHTKPLETHDEVIICPECMQEDLATVAHTIPFWTYIHHCGNCGYIIMESDWNKVINSSK